MVDRRRCTVALDGKTLRGSFDHLTDRKAVHVLSAFASDAALILAHQELAGAPDEVAAVPRLMAELGVTGVLFTAEALHCQRRGSRRPPRPAMLCWSASRITSLPCTQPWLGFAPPGVLSTAMKRWTAATMDARSMDGGDDRPGVGHLTFSALQLTTAVWPELAGSGRSGLELLKGVRGHPEISDQTRLL